MTHDGEPKQKTPKGHEIPVPKRDDVMRDLAKVAPPAPKPEGDDEDPSLGGD